ncbi:MAG: hypothetical protein ABI450_06960 [Rhizomicrobium sp.]
MRIDQARHQSCVTQIDHLRVRRMLEFAADGSDALAFHQYFTGADDAPVCNIQQSRGMKDHRVGRDRRCLRIRRHPEKRNRQRKQNKTADFHFSHPPVHLGGE